MPLRTPTIVKEHPHAQEKSRRNSDVSYVPRARDYGVYGIFIVPFLQSLYLSFTDAYGYNQTQNFIALDNYREALSNPGFRRAMLVTCKYTVFVTILPTYCRSRLRCCLMETSVAKAIPSRILSAEFDEPYYRELRVCVPLR